MGMTTIFFATFIIVVGIPSIIVYLLAPSSVDPTDNNTFSTNKLSKRKINKIIKYVKKYSDYKFNKQFFSCIEEFLKCTTLEKLEKGNVINNCGILNDKCLLGRTLFFEVRKLLYIHSISSDVLNKLDNCSKYEQSILYKNKRIDLAINYFLELNSLYDGEGKYMAIKSYLKLLEALLKDCPDNEADTYVKKVESLLTIL